nr:hypothetical protein [uncultured Oscillibacter sp.]
MSYEFSTDFYSGGSNGRQSKPSGLDTAPGNPSLIVICSLWASKRSFCCLLDTAQFALAVHFAADYIPKAEYLNGILLEPIAKYFTKVCDSLKQLLNESTRTEFLAAPEDAEKTSRSQEESHFEQDTLRYLQFDFKIRSSVT